MISRIATILAVRLFLVAAASCYHEHSCGVDVGGARVASDLEARFELDGPEWTGGSCVRSVRLPDGRVLWLFGLTFLGVVNSDNSRPTSAPVIANSIVVQTGDQMTTLFGGTQTRPEGYFRPSDGVGSYSPLDAIVEGDRLRVFLAFHETGFQVARVDVASLRLEDLSIERIQTIRVDPSVVFGVSLLPSDAYVYVYGVEDRRETKYLYVARAALGDVRGEVVAWEYFDGSAWTTQPGSSVRLSDRVSSSFGVVRSRGKVVLISQDTYFHADINVFEADDPTGPFTEPRTVYCTPESGGSLFTYNAVPHRWSMDTEQQSVLLSYSVNSWLQEDVFRDVRIFRPRFVRVPLR